MTKVFIKALVICLSIVTTESILAGGARANEMSALPFQGEYRCDVRTPKNLKLAEQLTIKWDMNSVTNPMRIMWSGPTSGLMAPDRMIRRYVHAEILIDSESARDSVEVFLRSYYPFELEGFYFSGSRDDMTTFAIDSNNRYNSYTLNEQGYFTQKSGTCSLLEGQDWASKLSQ